MIISFYLDFTIIFYIKKPFDILQTKNYDNSSNKKSQTKYKQNARKKN